MPIRVYIAPGNGVDGWNPRFDQVLGESFGTWQQASQNKVSFKPVTNPAEADLKCSWTSNSGTFKNRAEAGETTLMANSQGIVGGTISILTVPLMPELPVTDNRLRLMPWALAAIRQILRTLCFTPARSQTKRAP
jgi:hypothetical protein